MSLKNMIGAVMPKGSIRDHLSEKIADPKHFCHAIITASIKRAPGSRLPPLFELSLLLTVNQHKFELHL